MIDNLSPIIDLSAVNYSQGETKILSDVNWSLMPGAHWAVLGPNGSGKTTLLKIACGYLWPSSGRVLRLGQELIDLRVLREQIGWITSDHAALIPSDEVALETVVTGRLAQFGLKQFVGFEPREIDYADARNMLINLKCESLIEKPFGVLSQGERQQVLIARARMAKPLLLVLDEPCAGMDPGVRERFLQWLDLSLADLASPTVIFVTHHVEEIVPGIRHTLLMSEGRIRDQGATREIVTKEYIEQVYDVRLHSLKEYGGRLWPIWDS